MPPVRSAGILLFRRTAEVEVLLAHPGGPFWAKKDLGAWSVPKGEVDEGEDLRAAANREFAEELGQAVPDGDALNLGSVTQKNRKEVFVWAVEADFEPAQMVSNTFPMEWPPRSGRNIDVPEIDRVQWFDLDTAREKLNPAQAVFVDRLEGLLDY